MSTEDFRILQRIIVYQTPILGLVFIQRRGIIRLVIRPITFLTQERILVVAQIKTEVKTVFQGFEQFQFCKSITANPQVGIFRLLKIFLGKRIGTESYIPAAIANSI